MSLIYCLLISFVVCITLTAPVENESKIEASKIDSVQPESNISENVEVTYLNGRNLQGVPAPRNAFPFVVTLQVQNPQGPPGVMRHWCGGSIVSDRLIVTAAHCTESLRETTLYIKAGSTNINDPNGQTRTVAQIIQHPCYGLQTSDQIPYLNDIALLVLSEPLNFSQSIQPISLATDAHNVETLATGQILGWGATHGTEHTQTTDDLLYKDIDVIPPNHCAKHFIVHSNVLCVSNGDNSNAGPCSGDSGGPFIQKVGNKLVLAGITSYGYKVCGRGPTVYTRVSKYLNFINNVASNRPINQTCM